MTNPKILLLGDAMRDVYHIGRVERMSPEDLTIPVVRITESHIFPGGAANVRANLLALGVEVVAEYGRHGTPAWSVLPEKHRLFDGPKQLVRWDEYDSVGPVLSWPEGPYDGVVLSDYGKGSVTPWLISAVAKLGLPTFIDTKRSPRDFEEIRSATHFPNNAEYDRWLEEYALQDDVVHKRGPDGARRMCCGLTKQTCPSMVRRVVSVSGAGDTVLAAYVVAKLRGDIDPLRYAMAAAAVVVEKPWTATATPDEIEARIDVYEDARADMDAYDSEDQYQWGV